MTLEQLAHDVARARAAEAALLADIEARQAAFEASIQGLTIQLMEAKIARQGAEKWMREALIEAYAETGEKKLPGGSVRLVSRLKYSEQQAFEWAQKHQLALIPESLDQKAFEKLAKIEKFNFVQFMEKFDFVQFAEEPQAMIDTDLSAFLKQEVTAQG